MARALGEIEGLPEPRHQEGNWTFDDDDFLLMAMLQDPVCAAELLWEDPSNKEYGGCYRVRDYQYPLYRTFDNYAGYACARSVGKTESIKARSFTHAFRRQRENLLVTAPELIHLLPLTDAIEERIRDTRLTREFLDTRAGRSGFTHRPFGVDFLDGTKIVGRIPRLTGPQPLDVKVATPTGWTTMGEVRPGDLVLTPSGEAAEVTRVEDSTSSPVYEIEFTDGSRTRAGEDHDWFVCDPRVVPKTWEWRTTKEIAEALEARPGKMVHVPDHDPVVFADDAGGPLPLDPYVLGVLLGDGGFSGHSIFLTSADDEIVEMVRAGLPEGASVVADKRKYRYRIRGRGGRARNPVITALRDLGLLGLGCEEKFIPRPYMLAGVEDRRALLQGLVDTDGTVSKKGKVVVALKNRRLVEQIVELVRSLGGWASLTEATLRPYDQILNGKVYRNKGCAYWRATMVVEEPCRLSRKKERLRGRKRPRRRSIRSVTPLGPMPARCFRIETEAHLYLTDDYLPTGQTGVKGQHQPDLLIDEAQDYPDRGWVEVHEAQPLDAPVLTPTGYRRMGDLKAGDLVVGRDGLPTAVRDVFDHGEREVLRMHFSDGAIVECDADHWWTVTCNRHAGRWRTIRASEIEAALSREGGFGSLKQPWFVPHNEAVDFEGSGDLPLDPYLLGVALGDGCMRKGAFELAVGDEEILDHVGQRLHPDEEFVPAGRNSFRLRKRGLRSRHGRPPMMDALREVGVWGCLSHEKFVPTGYLLGTKRDRLELLRGLVDTDGNVDQRGAIRFCTSSPELADNVEFVVRSLGGRLRRSKQEDKRGYRTMYVLRFRIPGEVPCRLSRKVQRVRDVDGDSIRRHIVRVERAGWKNMRCIEVAADDGLYVADGFVVTHNTVMKDDPTFTYHFYGVHSGARDSGFHKRINEGGFKIVQVTAMQRPGWNKAEKDAAKAAYGGSSAPDFRRNILGEAGSAASAFFVTARLVACLDQNRESHYNQFGYVHQELRVEEVDELGLPLAEIMDLPSDFKALYCGMDVGLTNSPTVIALFDHGKFAQEKGDGKRGKEPARERLRLVRRYTLERFRSRQIREAMYAIGWHAGDKLKGFGVDATGLGFPIFQEMEDDEACPTHLRNVTRGFFFNSKLPVNVDPAFVTEDNLGNKRDQYGAAVKLEEDPLTGEKRLVTYQTMIEASTRYLREMVDSQFLLLPFDTEITTDMQGETVQRVTSVAKLQGMRKPNAFHILDAFRSAAMVFRGGEVEKALESKPVEPVLDVAMTL